MKRIAALAILVMAAVGCHPQAPQPSPGYNVNLTATAPPSDGNSAPFSYAVYRETITGTTCDPTTSTNWKEITTPTARPAAPSYVDGTATGLNVCYFMVTYQTPTGQTMPQNSGPSNTAAAQVPGVPLAPTSLSTTSQQAMNDAPLVGAPQPTLAKSPSCADCFVNALNEPTKMKVTTARR